jgi:transcriptional regulator with XRE-family HTH domain
VDGDELQRVAGRYIRAVRVERGISQKQFAELLSVHRTHLGGVERGERNLTLQSLARLARPIGVNPRRLLDDVEQNGAK